MSVQWREVKRLKKPTRNPGAWSQPYASYTIILLVSLLFVLLLPDSATRAILPLLVYAQTAVIGLYTFTLPILTAGDSSTRVGYLLARIGLIALATAFAAGVLVSLSGVSRSAPVVLLVALAAAGLFGGAGIAIASTAPSVKWFRAVTAGAFLVAALPVAGYLGVFEHVGLLYIPGGGPFALLSLALARPLEWAVFRIAWISGILYACAGLATGIVLFTIRAWKKRNAGSHSRRR